MSKKYVPIQRKAVAMKVAVVLERRIQLKIWTMNYSLEVWKLHLCFKSLKLFICIDLIFPLFDLVQYVINVCIFIVIKAAGYF